jgi:phosphoglycolate phosphatase-like HAD superfamily hydrolase
MNRVLKDHGLAGDFDLVVTSLDVKEPKPAPEALFKILDHFGLRAPEAIYIGDTELDEMAATAAGIPLVAYKNPRLSADYHVESFKQMEELLTKAWRD